MTNKTDEFVYVFYPSDSEVSSKVRKFEILISVEKEMEISWGNKGSWS